MNRPITLRVCLTCSSYSLSMLPAGISLTSQSMLARLLLYTLTYTTQLHRTNNAAQFHKYTLQTFQGYFQTGKSAVILRFANSPV